jgi:signal transduction histidine kinase
MKSDWMNPKILKILLIEDNPGDARLIEEMLKETGIQFRMEIAINLSSGIVLLTSNDFDLILLDLGLPDSQGLGSLAKLNESRPQAAVIVLTGLTDDAAGIEAVKEGAQDYLIKGQINNTLLARSINYAVERKKNQEERSLLIEKEQAAIAEAEAARKLDNMKSMFIASTSHELRTPLNSIIGFSSLLLDGMSGELTPDQKEQIRIIHSSGKHLLVLISDVIDLSKIEAGKISAVYLEFNLREAVNEAITMYKVDLDDKKLDLKVDVGHIVMKNDRKRLLQCIMNLLGNAIKFTHNGRIEITANVIKDNVEISVKDTGIGIKKEDIPQLFAPFVRLQTPMTAKTSGAGLGLYLVKRLATDLLGGDVKVESEIGKGSTFTLRIPIEIGQ